MVKGTQCPQSGTSLVTLRWTPFLLSRAWFRYKACTWHLGHVSRINYYLSIVWSKQYNWNYYWCKTWIHQIINIKIKTNYNRKINRYNEYIWNLRKARAPLHFITKTSFNNMWTMYIVWMNWNLFLLMCMIIQINAILYIDLFIF